MGKHIKKIYLAIFLSSLIILLSCKSSDLYKKVTTAPDIHIAQVPVYSHATGTYNPGVLGLTISTEAGATIRYTIDGSDPKTSGTAVDAAAPTNSVTLTINEHRIIKAFAYLTGHFDSDLLSGVVTREYTMARAADPVIAPASTTHITNATISITCATSDPTTIRYTTDGTVPTHLSPEYTVPFVINKNTTIKAIAYSDVDPQYVDSNVTTKVYNVKVATPTSSVASSTRYNDFNVTLNTTTPGATIRYTTDGTNPTAGSPAYGGPININGTLTTAGVVTLKLKAFKAGLVDSNTRTYTYTLKAAAPVFTHATGGPFPTPLNTETLTTTTTGATIAYAVNDDPITSPDDSGASGLAVNAIWVTSIINAYAYKAGYLKSATVTRNYNFVFVPVPGGIEIP